MKKIIFTTFLFLVFICNVKAFNIDMDKINISDRSNRLINELDKKYKIDLEDFYTDSLNDQRAINFTNKIVNISFGNSGIDKIKKELTNYLYISSDDGFETLSGVMFLDTYLSEINNNNIILGDVIDIRTASFNQNDVISFVYVKNAMVNEEKKDIVLTYWLKNHNSEYKVYLPWVCFNEDVNKYFEDISYIEETGKIIGDSYNKMSLDGNDSDVTETELLRMYSDNKDSVVQITTMGDEYHYGSGFYLREGIVVTTWSLFLQYLTDGDYIYVNDCNGNTYDVLGIIAADIKYDVVVLKIDKEVGKKVVLSSSDDVNSSNKLFTINSKYNSGFSINYGTNISYKNGKFKNMFALSSSDVGSALFNEDGHVVGFNVGDKLYSELSYANSTNYLRSIQKRLVNNKFEDINYTKIEDFKNNYYVEISNEKINNNVNKDVWNRYKSIGNLEKNIAMDLIKSSYKDGILSLRYNNSTNGMLDSIYMASSFTEELINQGYELTFYNEQKSIYKNDEYQIILKDNFNYLIVLIMEI